VQGLLDSGSYLEAMYAADEFRRDFGGLTERLTAARQTAWQALPNRQRRGYEAERERRQAAVEPPPAPGDGT